MINNIIKYFDLQSSVRTAIATGTSGKATFAPVIPQYCVVCAGIIIEPALRNYVSTGEFIFGGYNAILARVLFGLIIGVVILPGIYKSSFDPQKPILIQLAALFPMGLGWQSLFTAASKIAVGQ
jgi:hypothetical protein